MEDKHYKLNFALVTTTTTATRTEYLTESTNSDSIIVNPFRPSALML